MTDSTLDNFMERKKLEMEIIQADSRSLFSVLNERGYLNHHADYCTCEEVKE